MIVSERFYGCGVDQAGMSLPEGAKIKGLWVYPYSPPVENCEPEFIVIIWFEEKEEICKGLSPPMQAELDRRFDAMVKEVTKNKKRLEEEKAQLDLRDLGGQLQELKGLGEQLQEFGEDNIRKIIVDSIRFNGEVKRAIEELIK